MDNLDISTVDERLELIAVQPEYEAIRGELLHAVAELRANHQLLGIMMTVDGWRNAMGYINAGVCHGCGQTIFLPPPIFQPDAQ